jgi:hypothetical protein
MKTAELCKKLEKLGFRGLEGFDPENRFATRGKDSRVVDLYDFDFNGTWRVYAKFTDRRPQASGTGVDTLMSYLKK